MQAIYNYCDTTFLTTFTSLDHRPLLYLLSTFSVPVVNQFSQVSPGSTGSSIFSSHTSTAAVGTHRLDTTTVFPTYTRLLPTAYNDYAHFTGDHTTVTNLHTTGPQELFNHFGDTFFKRTKQKELTLEGYPSKFIKIGYLTLGERTYWERFLTFGFPKEPNKNLRKQWFS